MNNKEIQSAESIFDGTKRLLRGIPQVAAGIVGLSGFAYIIGWVYAQSYFSVFGAKWLITEIPVLTLMSYSWWPVIVVLFFVYLGLTDLAEIESKGSVVGYPTLARILSFINVVIVVAMATSAFEMLALPRPVPSGPSCVHAFVCWLRRVCLTGLLPKLRGRAVPRSCNGASVLRNKDRRDWPKMHPTV
jgi:hypothetical protein